METTLSNAGVLMLNNQKAETTNADDTGNTRRQAHAIAGHSVLTTHICHGSIRQRDRDNESLDAAVHSSIHGYYPDLSQ